MPSRRLFISRILPIATLSALLGGCGSDDGKELRDTKAALDATLKELQRTQLKLKGYEDREAFERQQDKIVEYALSDADVLALQEKTLSAILPTGGFIDPVLTKAIPNNDGTTYIHPRGWMSFSQKNNATYRAHFHLTSGKYAEDKKGRQQFYVITLELNNRSGDEVKLALHQVEVAFDGQGARGTARYPSYPRSFTASEVMEDEKLRALLPIITFMAAEAKRAGMPKADVFLEGLKVSNATRPTAAQKAATGNTDASLKEGPK